MSEPATRYSVRIPSTVEDFKDLHACGDEFDHYLKPIDFKSCIVMCVYRDEELLGWFQGYKSGIWFPAINPKRTTPARTYKACEMLISWAKGRAAVERDPIVGFVVVPRESLFTEDILSKLGLQQRPETPDIYQILN